MIKVKNLTVGYGENVIQKNISFSVTKGEILVILGASGCGKSTLLKSMIGLNPPLMGDIFINGKNIVTASTQEKRKIMQSFGVLYQSGALFGGMTIGENVGLLLEEFTNFSKEQQEDRINLCLKQVNIFEAKDKYPAEISGGMRKRAGIARAMALAPKLLFFDEPSAGLDPISSRNLDELILHVRRDFGVTIVIITHELASIFTIADRAIILGQNGQGIIEEGDPKILRTRSKVDWVRKFFNRDADFSVND